MPFSILFVLGGARSGKSRYALGRAEASGLSPVFIATAQAFDAEMEERIARHKAERGPAWTSLEAPLALAETIANHAAPDRVLVVDCLTLWATNLMLGEHDSEAAFGALALALRAASGPVILVSNEVGMGIVPDNALARAFRDLAGRLNQKVAAIADEVQFVAAGLPLRMK
ncbi:bifunctional adenosylcobinamide kinase/adenosylcobinamide-phosphate guanylyltransferase [Allosphingosinicella deserti]|uniref:Bifunctional adenosylcobalamin biosynthesis protein n=1 Tax=Allosphingosinicella deserti TaxID=2116704 RepID=A0A2P7QK11_9SPHN|nr:bifunctional adenosylcobinamide kinase/adenosylcobinamide-phosphate guanylyltransferase [Sphingomonas deserti]PSJ38307.1 bifunctional adenosylcobinamide kinase/adenosylcobinamide-phosphate guanylyltransferase [Sphingomonas deserti]